MSLCSYVQKQKIMFLCLKQKNVLMSKEKIFGRNENHI